MEPTGATNVLELLGARKDYYVLLDHYETQLKTKCDGSMEKLIAGNFPLLSAGLAGSALHGLIQLGYGYAAKNARFQPQIKLIGIIIDKILLSVQAHQLCF